MPKPWFSPPSVSPEWREAEDKLADTLRPSHSDLAPLPSPALPKQRRRRPWLATAVIATALFALASVIGLVTGKITPSGALAWLKLQRATATASPTTEPAATPATSPAADTTATAATAASGDSSRLKGSPTSAPSGTAEKVAVTVRVSPPNAVISKDGQIIGTREVTLSVVSGTTTTLVAQLHGYVTNTVAIDGTQKSVDIIMIPWKSTPPTATATPREKAGEAPPAPSSEQSERNSGDTAPRSGAQWDPSGI